MPRGGQVLNRKLCWAFVTLGLCWLLAFSSLSHSSMLFEAFVVLPSPKQAWDYVADLNHMWTTNPGLIDFTIQSSGGSHPVWKYDVLINERVAGYGLVSKTAHYVVEPADSHAFRITTTASFCKFLYLCVSTTSTMTFAESHKNAAGTQMRDDFKVMMPPLLGWVYGHKPLQMHHRGMLDRIVGQLERLKHGKVAHMAARAM